MDKLKIVTIVGARPQFIKAAAVSRAVRNSFSDEVSEVIIHTGQHYDDNMSRVFFEEMGIPEPDYNLATGSGSHGFQTGEMLQAIEKVLFKENPGIVLVYGDTNTTLAGALAASKMHIPVAHVEAGLRSFNKSMPEEINRLVCDHLSTFLFSPTKTGIANLVSEGFDISPAPPYSIDRPGIFHCGDVMYDNAIYYTQSEKILALISQQDGIGSEEYILCTIHRDNNTDSADRLNAIFQSLDELSRSYRIPFILPLHPRTAKMLPVNLREPLKTSLQGHPFLRIITPVSYVEMLALERGCRMVITDSGGVQKESYFFGKPCLVLRAETEWKELLHAGTSVVVDADPAKIHKAFAGFFSNPPTDFPAIFGDGRAAEFILGELVKNLHPGLVK
jgi:UDP-GlcNAc3NAcA epimerase